VDGGGKIADLAVSAAVITSEHDAHAEISFEGNVSVDVKTGQILALDLIGKVDVAGGVGTASGGRKSASVVSLTATGKVEIRGRGRMLPPTATSQPAGSNLAATDAAK
jgi:hypothetical protein